MIQRYLTPPLPFARETLAGAGTAVLSACSASTSEMYCASGRFSAAAKATSLSLTALSTRNDNPGLVSIFRMLPCAIVFDNAFDKMHSNRIRTLMQGRCEWPATTGEPT